MLAFGQLCTYYIHTMHSGILISQADARPMYLQIVEQVRQRVAAGDWPPGKEMPSIRALAADLRVSVITVKRAYLDLETEGVIVTRQGKGSFVADAQDLAQSLRDVAAQGDMIICMGAGDITKWAAGLPEGIKAARASK